MLDEVHHVFSIHRPLQLPHMSIYDDAWQWRAYCSWSCEPRDPHLPCRCPHRKLEVRIRLVVVALFGLDGEESWLVAEVGGLIDRPLFVVVVRFVAEEGSDIPLECGGGYVGNGEVNDLGVLEIVLEGGGECFDRLCGGPAGDEYVAACRNGEEAVSMTYTLWDSYWSS